MVQHSLAVVLGKGKLKLPDSNMYYYLDLKERREVLHDGVTALKNVLTFRFQSIIKDFRKIFHSRPIPALYRTWFRS